MKNFGKILTFVVLISIFSTPVLSFATHNPEGLIPCGQTVEVKDKDGKIINITVTHPCTFTDFLTLINKVIDFTIVKLALPIAAIMFAYAGFLLVMSQGGESKTKAKTIFTNTVLGLVIAVGAWLIVKTLLSIAGYNNTGMFF